MSDHWEFYPTRIDDHPAFVFYDHGLAETIDALALPNALKVKVEFDDPSDAGPKQSEFERLTALEDGLAARIQAAGGVYVGRITMSDVRYFHCLVALDADGAERLVQQIERESGYELAFRLEPDPEKVSYWEEIFPTPGEWRLVQDMKVLEVLKEHGDDPSIPRRIDHWLYFPQQAERDRFEDVAKASGLSVEKRTEGSGADRKYGVQIYQIGRPVLDEIAATTQFLLQKANELGGEYDGWETHVKKRE